VKVSALARRHGLSRSTLLYYDRIGLLKAGGRTGGGYRDYTAGDELPRVTVSRELSGTASRPVRVPVMMAGATTSWGNGYQRP
jgi:DNA-binding transcriptional MerR regulator